MIINNNISALNTYRQMGINQGAGAKAMEKLSSGLRINKAGDDAAGLAISEKMRAQVRGLDQASRNSQDGISMIQTAEGALQETHNILQRMRELATQAANDTNVEVDREEIQKEMNQLTSEINRIGNTTEFNTQKILNGGMDSKGGDKITQATSAEVTATGTVADGAITGTITVDGKTFTLDGPTLDVTANGASTEADAAIAYLKNVTSGGEKLSDYVDITNDSGTLTFTAKSAGPNSSISFGADIAALGITAADDKDTGDPTTVEKHGIQGSTALGLNPTNVTTPLDNTIAANSSFTIAVGSESAVTINLKEKTYATATGADDNVKQAAMHDLVKDLNAALQDAGLDGKVTASLSKDNEVQFISETGKDIALTDTNGVLATIGVDTSSDTIGNVQQVAGPGAQGAGFTAKFQIGANEGQSINLNINDMRAAALGVTGAAGQKGFTVDNSVTNGTNDIKAEAALDVSTHENAAAAITTINDAIEKVSAERSSLGAIQNRLEHTISNLSNASENLQAAESRIRDVDMAKEVMEMTRANILGQASQAMLAQANQKPQAVLQLLG
ncbi:flagellin [Cytobacillus firmus]|uniref:flagellin N-terminal helical domain-containing protein n=1 Tax=Cytobacillus firmus TaxID=1399 RepID=UPI0018CF6117|nr:flagellin [Cytobacillus firmus]MBG9657787.1 flagellin [Cytobacillus firmus]MED1904781.1 flagellin [Cytobacillus firmus]